MQLIHFIYTVNDVGGTTFLLGERPDDFGGDVEEEDRSDEGER